MGLIQDIGGGPVAFDTVAFIYLIEEHPRFLPILEPVFATIDSGTLEAVSSTLTLLEVLVVPYRVGDLRLAQRYEEILTGSRGLRLVDISRALLRSAAQLRGMHRALKTPDAIQLCTALGAGCTSFVTNDRELPTIPGFTTLQLKDYVRTKG